MKARLIFMLEDFSASMTASYRSCDECFVCDIAAADAQSGRIPSPIILGFFSPFRNSPTTTRVMDDPMSIPTEIFRIIFF